MSKYRIVKADEAILIDDTDEWVIPYRIQTRVWGIWPLFKNWIWVTGQRVTTQWEGARTTVRESIEEPLNFPSEESALKFLTDHFEKKDIETLNWGVVKEFKLS